MAALVLDESVWEWEALSTITALKPFINIADITFQVLRSRLCKCQLSQTLTSGTGSQALRSCAAVTAKANSIHHQNRRVLVEALV